MKQIPITAIALVFTAVLPLQAAPLSAANDSKAVFENHTFNLPDVGEKDSYTIFIEVEGEKDTRRLPLPAGVSGFRLNPKAVPTAAWTWSYKIQREKPAEIRPITDDKVTIDRQDLIDGNYLLAWTPISGAKTYKVSGTSRLKVRPTDDPAWEKFSGGECFASVCGRGATATRGIPLKPGMEVQWQITALDSDGIVIAQSELRSVSVKTTWAQAATNTGFKFQRSDTLSPSSVGLPATFGYASSQKDGSDRSSAFQAEFAFVWESPTVLPSGFAPRASLEAQLNSSGDKKANDLVRARIGASKMLHGASEGTGIELTTNLKYETERKTGTKKGLIEVVATPIYGVLGTYWPGPPKPSQATQSLNYRVLPSIQIAPLLKFGAEIGKAFDTGTSTETGDTLVRYKTIGRLDTEFNFLASALSLRNVTGYLEATYWRLPRETKKSHHLAKTGLSFGLSDEISIDLSYSVGRDSPSFKFARSGIVGLGIKF